MALVIDPSSAVAAAKCLAARLWDDLGMRVPPETHPRPCLWEDWTKESLVGLLVEFHNQVGYDIDTDGYASIDVQRFRALPRSEQVRMVRDAQYGRTAA